MRASAEVTPQAKKQAKLEAMDEAGRLALQVLKDLERDGRFALASGPSNTGGQRIIGESDIDEWAELCWGASAGKGTTGRARNKCLKYLSATCLRLPSGPAGGS